MKNPYELIRLKEQEIVRLKREIDALRIAAQLLVEEIPQGNGKAEVRRVVDMP